MHIKDKLGREWICLCRQWDGEKWNLIPEWIMKSDYWFMINYFIESMITATLYLLNLDENAHVLSQGNTHYIFEPKQPIPA
jgi:hypothetical protein